MILIEQNTYNLLRSSYDLAFNFIITKKFKIWPQKVGADVARNVTSNKHSTKVSNLISFQFHFDSNAMLKCMCCLNNTWNVVNSIGVPLFCYVTRYQITIFVGQQWKALMCNINFCPISARASKYHSKLYFTII